MANIAISIWVYLAIGLFILIGVVVLFPIFGQYDSVACQLGIKDCPEPLESEDNETISDDNTAPSNNNIPTDDFSIDVFVNDEQQYGGTTITLKKGINKIRIGGAEERTCRAYILVDDTIYSETQNTILVIMAKTQKCTEEFTFNIETLTTEQNAELDVIAYNKFVTDKALLEENPDPEQSAKFQVVVI